MKSPVGEVREVRGGRQRSRYPTGPSWGDFPCWAEKEGGGRRGRSTYKKKFGPREEEGKEEGEPVIYNASASTKRKKGEEEEFGANLQSASFFGSKR